MLFFCRLLSMHRSGFYRCTLGEAERLRISQVRDGLIQLVQTKSSKARSVPIAQEIENDLKDHHEKYGTGERLNYRQYKTRDEAMKDIADYYIKPFYNRKRRHSTLGNMSPTEYEEKYQQKPYLMS